MSITCDNEKLKINCKFLHYIRLTNGIIVLRHGRVVKAFASPFAHSRAEARFEPDHGHRPIPATVRTRLTQPDTLCGTVNRVPASAGVMAGMLPLSGGR